MKKRHEKLGDSTARVVNRIGRPRLSDAERARRGTLRADRIRDTPMPGKVGRPALSDVERERRGTLRPFARRDSKPTAPRLARLPKVSPRDYVSIAEEYVADVLARRIVSSAWVRLACDRHRRDRARATDPTWPYVFSDRHVIEACHFLENLPHVEGAWTTTTLHLEPCQVFWLASLFGWRQRGQLTRRRFTVFYLELGRKGAKSTLMAGIALFHLLAERELGAQVICGATTGSQARIVFSIAQAMVRRAVWLQRRGVQALANAIITPDGVIKPVNAKASTQDGLNPSCIILDESHAQDFGLHDVLKSAQGARQNPLMLCPTTAGYDLLSVGYALHTTVTRILDQTFEADHVFGIIYTIDVGDDWRDGAVWIKANPMIGITPRLDRVREYCSEVQHSPGQEGEFRVKICSEWFQAANTWLSMTQWDACADLTLRLEAFTGARCWIGADLAQIDDLAAVALLFERGDDIVAFVTCYLPRDVVAVRARRVPAYAAWAASGVLQVSDGAMIDYGRIEADIRAWCKRFNVQALRFDQYGSAGIVSSLAGDGFPAAILDKNRKTMTPPARDLEARVAHGKFRHDGNPCLKWQAGNVVVTRGIDDSVMPKKESTESPNKIDAIDAILQAMSAMITIAKPRDYQVLVFG